LTTKPSRCAVARPSGLKLLQSAFPLFFAFTFTLARQTDDKLSRRAMYVFSFFLSAPFYPCRSPSPRFHLLLPHISPASLLLIMDCTVSFERTARTVVLTLIVVQVPVVYYSNAVLVPFFIFFLESVLFWRSCIYLVASLSPIISVKWQETLSQPHLTRYSRADGPGCEEKMRLRTSLVGGIVWGSKHTFPEVTGTWCSPTH